MNLTGKKVLVYGAGRSGIGACNLLTSVGACPLLFDQKAGLTAEALKEQNAGKLTDPGHVMTAAGSLDAATVSGLDLAVLSPGVPTDLPEVKALHAAGVPVWGEVELAYECGKGTVLAITGTNGKTTTTALLGEIMAAVRDSVFVVGNIGNAYTGAALSTTDDSVVVAEISSFQLETIENFHPAVSAILNITEDHLNRHHSMEEYIRVKELITKNQTKEDVCVLNYEDEVLRAFGEVCPASVVWFSSARELEEGFFVRDGHIMRAHNGMTEDLLDTDGLYLIGSHNHENIMAAVAMALAAGADLTAVLDVVKRFRPVAHRIEYIAEKRGVVWYNDSKGTNPDAAIRGIRAMKRPTYLIAGGYDKGSDYTEWIRSFDGKVRKLVLEGKTRFDIRKAALSCGFPEEDIVMRETMTEAMEYCRDHAVSGEAVLLSPACASWGEFPNYEVRGDVFREYVEKEI